MQRTSQHAAASRSAPPISTQELATSPRALNSMNMCTVRRRYRHAARSSEASSRPAVAAGAGASDHFCGVELGLPHPAEMVCRPNSPVLMVHM